MRRVVIIICVVTLALLGLILGVSIGRADTAYVRVSQPDVPRSLMKLFDSCGKRHNVEPLFLASVFSAGEHNAKWPTNGPWASSPRGAQGPLQFMPGTWPSWAEDGDGDGNANVQNIADASCSAAKYLASAGARGVRGSSKEALAHFADAASIYNCGESAWVCHNDPETGPYIASVVQTYLVLLKASVGVGQPVDPLINILANELPRKTKHPSGRAGNEKTKNDPTPYAESPSAMSVWQLVLVMSVVAFFLLLLPSRRDSKPRTSARR